MLLYSYGKETDAIKTKYHEPSGQIKESDCLSLVIIQTSAGGGHLSSSFFGPCFFK